MVNTTNATNATFTPSGPGAGTFSFGNRNDVNFTGMESVTTNVITIVATDATASERGADQAPDTATFTLTRTGDATNALTVNFAISGTAVNYRDYQGVTGQAFFAAGSSTATVTINPLNNSLIDGTRTVTITLAAGAGYSFAAGASATATIADNDSVNRRFAVGTAAGGLVSVTNTATGSSGTFAPIPGYTGAVNVAVGDVNGDGIADLAAVSGIGGPSFIVVYDGATGALRLVIPILGGTYLGGSSITIGDVDGDGRGEIIIGLQTNLPAVGVFDGLSGNLRTAFFAFPGAIIGVNVAAGDLDGDGKAEIITAPTGIGPLVNVFDGNGQLKSSFLAFSPVLGGVGLTLAAGDLDGDGKAEIVGGIHLVGGPVTGDFVAVYSGNGTLRGALQVPSIPTTISQFGPPVATADVNGDGAEDILVTVGQFLGFLDGRTFGLLSATIPFPGVTAGITVG